jgi:PPOX class probable FMN-dependent enzyme
MPDSDYAWTDALQRAVKRNRRDAHNRYLQLATVRADGSPAVRTLVFRELCPVLGELRMVTDQRSAKAAELARDPRSEIAWYFSHTREQFRLRGRLEMQDATCADPNLRLHLWAALSDAAREQFFWIHPGMALGSGSGPAATEDMPPDSFAALCLRVEEIDHLTLRGDPQTRRRGWRTSDGWEYEAINP